MNYAYSLMAVYGFIMEGTEIKSSFCYAEAARKPNNGILKKRRNIGIYTMNKRKIKYQTLDEYVAERFREHPEEISGFLETVLEEYEKDPDEGALLMALRQVAKANGGMTELARKTNLSRESLYKTLSPSGNPRLKNLQRIMETFGYTLTFKPLKSVR